jgi:hypothetical protein
VVDHESLIAYPPLIFSREACMHGVSFPYRMHVRIGFGRCCLSAFTPLSIQGSVLVWGWERERRPGAELACLGRLYSSIFLIFTQQLSIGRYVLSPDAMVPSYKRGREDIFALFCSLQLKFGFWVAIPFDTTVFTRPVSLGSLF